jgi:hypothetical protein
MVTGVAGPGWRPPAGPSWAYGRWRCTKHVANKDALPDVVVESVVGTIALPDPDAPWQDAMRQGTRSARDVLRRHPWAIGL